MKNFAKIALTASFIVAGLVVARPAFAETTTTQTVNGTNVNNSSTTIICNTGAYGTNNCHSTTNQTITQVLGREHLFHKPTKTGSDMATTAGVVATMITTASGAVVTYKKFVR